MDTFTLPHHQDLLVQVQSWEQALEAVAQRIAPRFARPDARHTAQEYLCALLSPIERKNGWQMAEQLGHTTPYRVQHLLGRAVWDADAVRDDLVRYVVEHRGDPEGVLVLDETGFIKKGDKSCGVARQYSGTAGRIENCQIGVFLCYATGKGHTFLDRQLYLPKEWTDDPLRCRAADVPDRVGFITRPKIARQMLERAFAAGVPCRWVTGDSVYGNDRSLQLWLQQHGVAHVLAVTGQESVWVGFQPHRVKELLPSVPEEAWHRLCCGEGSKGPRLYEWARLPLNHGQGSEWERWLLVRKSLFDPEERTGYIAFAPAGTPLEKLVQVAGTRWTIECCFESAKGEVGLDEYEVRSFHGWHRHITLAMLAHAFLTVLRAQERECDLKKGRSNPSNSLRQFKQSRGLWCA
ncbi:MAG TPA: IS701 family transposase [Chthonomonadaceae bacterium]|nr:IS701 family transposase [Chthonomonadaceae bacterium]